MALIKELKDLNYPVFRLNDSGVSNFCVKDGVVFAKMIDASIRIIDDRNIDARTLGERRLLLPPTVEVFTIGRGMMTLRDLLLSYFSTSSTIPPLFIDSTGKVVSLKKTDFARITYYPIKKVTGITDSQYLIHVKNVHVRFLHNKPPDYTDTFVALLKYGNGYLFMGYSDNQYDTYRIKI